MSFSIILLLLVVVFLAFYLHPRKGQENYVENMQKKQKPCEYNPDYHCPHAIDITSNGRVVVPFKSMKCCKVRRMCVRTAKKIVDGEIPSEGSKIIEESKVVLDKHKKNFPEEHKEMFG